MSMFICVVCVNEFLMWMRMFVMYAGMYTTCMGTHAMWVDVRVISWMNGGEGGGRCHAEEEES